MAFPSGQWKLAAIMTATTPGIFMLHEGQMEGRSIRLPVFLGRRPEENPSEEVLAFYKKLLVLLKRPELSGHFEALPTSHPVMCEWQWHGEKQSLLIWANPTKRFARVKHDNLPQHSPIWAEGYKTRENQSGNDLFLPFGFAIWEVH
ncbi:MAG: hypothetical protein WHS45_03365 [Anaerolinea sp.]